MSEAAKTPSRWSRICRHPVFPLLVYLALTQLIRDEYPFSHYPMYSKPNSESLTFQYLGDGSGRPLPFLVHTGISPSQLSKLHRDRSRTSADETETAKKVLAYLKELNEPRKATHPLPPDATLMEMTVRFDKDGHLVEKTRKLASLDER